jgi:osmotically-inducible protein OsmY
VAWLPKDDATDWGDSWTDADTQRMVEGELQINPWVSAFNVTTSVKGGVVTLTGTVGNLRAKREAEEEALDTLGVWRVKNYLRVRPPLLSSDADMAKDIRKALKDDPHVDRYDITVSVLNGKAYLRGEVDSWYMREQAEQAAERVRGVVDIQNSLHVGHAYTAKSDREIQQDIEDELFWSPLVDSDDISVEVHSGVATLRGSVEDWGELQIAEENARQGGATSVISDLKIKNVTQAD